MPGKHVRFSTTNLVYSPSLTAPSPSYSISSLASSPGLVTPPQLAPISLPYPPHRKPIHFEPVRINPLLAVSRRPAIAYDVSLHHSHAAPPRGHSLAEPATSPAVPHMTIVSPHLPWSIVVSVRPSPGAFVSVYDVFATMYGSLRHNVSKREFDLLPTSKARARATASYERRYHRIRDPRAYSEEKQGGVRRVDFLMEQTRFLGLSPTPGRPDVWVLNVG